MENSPETLTFQFLGSDVCLDFINTQLMANGQPVDLLHSFSDLVAWSIEAGIISPGQGEALIQNWAGHPKADQVFEQALALRATLKELVIRFGQRADISESSLELLNELLRERAGYFEVQITSAGLHKHFLPRMTEPVDILVPIAEAAADLLSSDDPTLVRKCEATDCLIYFYDTTKNHARRWCSMSLCGNRAKAAAHYRRKRQDVRP